MEVLLLDSANSKWEQLLDTGVCQHNVKPAALLAQEHRGLIGVQTPPSFTSN